MTCLIRTSTGWDIACIDDLCHGNDVTLCGLHRYVDFDVEDEDNVDDYWDDEPPQSGRR